MAGVYEHLRIEKAPLINSRRTSNRKLLRSAFAEAESYIDGQGVEDDAGHGTAVAGIALYGNLEVCVATNTPPV